VERTLGVSERRACGVLGQPRSTQRRPTRIGGFVRRLLRRIHELVRRFPRYGYRRITALLRDEGFPVNPKRIHRLWRREGLKVPLRQRKRRRLGSSEQGCVRLRAAAKDDVWSVDFAFDRTEDGRGLKLFVVVDEFTRECLAIEARRWIKAEDVLDVLTLLFVTRGVPRHIRSDNGPEFIARAVRTHLDRCGVRTLYIEPGSPWENGYAESFVGRLRDELLDREVFDTLGEAQALAESWRREYNEHRPHSALGYVTPARFALTVTATTTTTAGIERGFAPSRG
jgi:transposase InsO family protein